MTKIEEIIESNFGLTNSEENVDLFCSARNAMVEYAGYYAQKCLEIAVENTTISINDYPGVTHVACIDAYDHVKYDQTFKVDKDSILNIKLPEHE